MNRDSQDGTANGHAGANPALNRHGRSCSALYRADIAMANPAQCPRHAPGARPEMPLLWNSALRRRSIPTRRGSSFAAPIESPWPSPQHRHKILILISKSVFNISEITPFPRDPSLLNFDRYARGIFPPRGAASGVQPPRKRAGKPAIDAGLRCRPSRPPWRRNIGANAPVFIGVPRNYILPGRSLPEWSFAEFCVSIRSAFPGVRTSIN